MKTALWAPSGVRGHIHLTCIIISLPRFVGVLATYRRSLCCKQRDSFVTTQKRLMCSRQQRVSILICFTDMPYVCCFNPEIWQEELRGYGIWVWNVAGRVPYYDVWRGRCRWQHIPESIVKSGIHKKWHFFLRSLIGELILRWKKHIHERIVLWVHH